MRARRLRDDAGRPARVIVCERCGWIADVAPAAEKATAAEHTSGGLCAAADLVYGKGRRRTVCIKGHRITDPLGICWQCRALKRAVEHPSRPGPRIRRRSR